MQPTRSIWTALAAAVATALAPAAPGGDGGRALVVGVGDYPRPRELYGEARYEAQVRLDGPANDARLVARTLVEVLRLPADRVRVRTRPEETTRAALLEDPARLAREARPGELVVLYLAGHGTQQPDADGRGWPPPAT